MLLKYLSQVSFPLNFQSLIYLVNDMTSINLLLEHYIEMYTLFENFQRSHISFCC